MIKRIIIGLALVLLLPIWALIVIAVLYYMGWRLTRT